MRAVIRALAAALAACAPAPGDGPPEDPPREGDPCRSEPPPPPERYQPIDLPGDIVWIETPEIEHDRDYYDYIDFINPAAPTDWTSPVDFTEGQVWIHVEVLETPPGFVPPVYYTVTWDPGREGVIDGFLRAAVEIDKPGPAVYDEVADVRSIEYSPDGTCCQSVCDRPWPWDAAWQGPNGDVIVLDGEGFPLRVRTRLVLRPPP